MLKKVNMRFHGELNDFLPDNLRNTHFSHQLKKPGSIKDLVESVGVPHTEVDLIIVNGKSVDFYSQVQYGDDISIYPIPTSTETETKSPPVSESPLIHNHPKPLDTPRFVLDVHLGRLAAYLRLLGFDTLYRNDYDDPALARISADETRILLTCDRRLLMRKQIIYGYFVRNRQPHQQLLEVLTRYDLTNQQQPFTRCTHCNGKIKAINKKEIENRLQPKTKKYYNKFFQCESCNKVYWKGSHYKKIQEMINKITVATETTTDFR